MSEASEITLGQAQYAKNSENGVLTRYAYSRPNQEIACVHPPKSKWAPLIVTPSRYEKGF